MNPSPPSDAVTSAPSPFPSVGDVVTRHNARRLRSRPPYWWSLDLGRAWVEIGRLTRPCLRVRRDEVRCWTWYVRWGCVVSAPVRLTGGAG